MPVGPRRAENDDGTIFLISLDIRDVELDMDDDMAATTFVLLSPRLAVVRPYDQRR